VTRTHPRFCVLKADGTNCEVETAHALREAGAQAEIVPMNLLRWRERRLADFDGLVAAGGFSYGDDVASGKVMAVELMSFLADDIRTFAALGKPILGICNGFQVLVRTGLLPFGQLGQPATALTTNDSGRYECRWVRLGVVGRSSALCHLPPEIELPSAHAEGRLQADAATLARIEDEGLVAFRFLDQDGHPTNRYPANPSGSVHAIAGVSDPTGRILGLMPHPERFVRPHQHPAPQLRPPERQPDGLQLLRGVVALA
jgi:phosphoribosylformylglycinamidine synthase I